jgi:hypothetical protein
MTEIRFVAKEIAASRQQGIPTDECKLWETLRLDAAVVVIDLQYAASFLGQRRLRSNDERSRGNGDYY